MMHIIVETYRGDDGRMRYDVKLCSDELMDIAEYRTDDAPSEVFDPKTRKWTVTSPDRGTRFTGDILSRISYIGSTRGAE